MEESKVENSEIWRTQLHPDSRNRVVNFILNTLRRVLPFSGAEAISELLKVAERFEEKGYSNSHSQSDYVHYIWLKMMTIESYYFQEAARAVSLPYYPVHRDLRLDVHHCQTSGGSQLQADYRMDILCKMWNILKIHLCNLGPLEDALKMVSSFEEEIYSASSSQSDYLHRLSLKILALEENSENSCSISNQNTST